MSLPAYEDFYYAACLAFDGDPVTAWHRQSEQVRRLTEWIQGREEVRIQAEGTDITLGVAGRNWIACVGEHNMPDGEFFTGPVEDAVNGHISFSFPASYGGRTVSGVCLRFEDGKVVDASAEQGEEFLKEMLDTDSGARRLGELGIGTNFGISTGTKEILLDEKIGGTIHMAVGMSYPETRRHEQLGRPLGHGLRPSQGRLDHRRRQRAAARRQVPGLARRTARGR